MKFDNVSRNQLCPCGSNKKFKHCHGNLNQNIESSNSEITINASHILSNNGYYIKSLMSDEFKNICQDLPSGMSKSINNVPPGMIIIEDFINDKLCDDLVKQTENVQHIKATLVDVKDKSDSYELTVDESKRKTEIFDLGEFDTALKNNLIKLFKELLDKHYGVTISSYEQPHILRYSEGGFFGLHADSEYWDASNKKWKRIKPRDLSFLLYLNDEYTGGELEFPNFYFTLKPKKGMFVCFPSDHRFMHFAKTTTSGKRYAIVSWAAIDDPSGSNEIPVDPDRVIFVE